MNILFVTPPPTLPSRLHRVRGFEFIRMLAKKHRLFLLSVTTDQHVPKEFKHIEKLCQKVVVVTLNPYRAMIQCLLFPQLPFEVSYCHNEGVMGQIENIIETEKISLLYLKRLRSAIWLRQKINIPVILDATDAMSMFYERAQTVCSWWQKPFFWHEKVSYRIFERQGFKSIKNWIVSSNIDAHFLKKNAPEDAHLFTIPNPVDTYYFYPRKAKEIPQSILFRGLMDKLVNIDAALYFVNVIFPLIARKIPAVRLTIAGPNPVSSIRKLNDGKKITVAGYVDNMVNTIAKHELVICPIRIASGTRHKILQSWAMEKAVVSTFRGAEGLHARHGKNILLAGTAAQFASCVVELLTHKRRRQEIGRAGRKTVERFYSLGVVGRELNNVVSKVYSQKR